MYNMLKNKRSLLAAASLMLFLVLPTLSAGASQLGQASVRLSRMSQSAASPDLYVTFKLNTTPTSVAKVSICLPNTKSDNTGAGFTVTAVTPTVSTANPPNTPSGTTVPPGTLTASASTTTTGQCATGGQTWAGVITVTGFTSASLNSTALYEMTITGTGLTNPSANAQYNTAVNSLSSTPTVIDTTTTPSYVTNATGDQVTVTGSVAPNFSFSLSANTDTIPAVDPSSIQTSGGGTPVYMTVATNSPLGYTAYVKSAANQLASALHPGTPITGGTFDGSPDTISAGTTKYGFVPSTGAACSTCVGVPAYDAEYAIADGTHAGAFNSTSFASFVSHANYTSGDQIFLKERDAVGAAIQYSNDYTDVLTIVAAGNF
jgi:hypothetical protein